ncbi:MAG: hypothetical protein Q8O87_03355 [bacterium]|nr:hypothetical protein [bacterium]
MKKILSWTFVGVLLVGVYILVTPSWDYDFPRYRGESITKIGDDPFIQQVPQDYAERYQQELSEYKESLANDPSDIEGWLRVGVIKHFFNNHDGAKDVWEYAKLVNPKHSTAYYNLGGLYAWYLNDLEAAEENYLEALEIDPTLPYIYLGLAEFYSVFYTDKNDQIEEVISRGLKILPDDESLLKALEDYR